MSGPCVERDASWSTKNGHKKHNKNKTIIIIVVYIRRHIILYDNDVLITGETTDGEKKLAHKNRQFIKRV